MVVPASFQVSETGAATYSIPIQTPPGIAGMEPKLSFNYSSQGGNGLLGFGWSLGGLGTISRCPRTVAQDGFRGSIGYDTNDRYCLDGQRLIAINGVEGGDGTEYRTERENFAKIVSYGTAGNGPAWFKVWTKSGQVMAYGSTTDSRIEAQGRSTVAIWALNRIEDTKQNSIVISYIKESDSVDFYPNRVDYSGKSAGDSGSNAAILFQYESRPDISQYFQVGSLVRNTKRLKSLTTQVGTQTVTSYQLSYGAGPFSMLSRLESIEVCSGIADVCLPKTTFDWTTNVGITGFNAAGSATWIANIGVSAGETKILDINGDGRSDIAIPVTSGAWDGSWNICLATDTGFNCSTVSTNLATYAYNIHVVDLNGDGKSDLMGPVGGGSWNVCLSNGAGFSCNTWTSNNAATVANTLIADVNGDGRSDMLTPVGNGNWNVCVSGGDHFGCATWPTNNAASVANTVMVDLNGDGMSDMMTPVGNGNWNVCLSTGGGFNCATWYSSNAAVVADTLFLDLNGDGKTDMMTYVGSGNWNVCLSTGIGFSCGTWYTAIGVGAQSVRTGDFNGDGKADIMTPVGNGNWNVCLSTGFSFNCATWGSNNGASVAATMVGDFNGDGKTDMATSLGNGGWNVSLADANEPGQIQTISQGVRSMTISYTKLNGGSIYTKDTGAVYPLVDVQGAMSVVASIKSTNGVGGTTSTAYTYGGLRVESGTGRGMLGFRWMQSRQVETGLASYTEYRQDYPYIGLPSLSKKTVSGGGNSGVLSQTVTTYGCSDPAATTVTACTFATGKRYFVYGKQSVESSWDYNGTALPVITTSSEYDNWGNATKVEVTTDDGFKKSTVNTYANDSVNWYLGRLLKSSVTSTSP
ncbi:FG-GAP-like repeat-containing protein [Herbaspirillum sp. C9C3]|uniref:FG-GAP-like repeat-containing protein n=1 Tax=Herbaspirillum sp. C9C3 TaxID=2735271 RepID=UPI0024C055A1|nr:FG-GAP-like repeat-containing protein [Herbaspirillum sp. C9C3]